MGGRDVECKKKKSKKTPPLFSGFGIANTFGITLQRVSDQIHAGGMYRTPHTRFGPIRVPSPTGLIGGFDSLCNACFVQ